MKRKIKRDGGYNPVRRLIAKSLQIAHECKGLSEDDAADLKRLCYSAQASIERKQKGVTK